MTAVQQFYRQIGRGQPSSGTLPEASIEVPRSSTFLHSRFTQVGHEHRFSVLPPMRRRTVQCACYTGNWFNWMKSADVDLGIQAKQIAASSGGVAKA
jgi:hypothetical protein